MAIIEIFNGMAINCVMLQASPFWMVGGGGCGYGHALLPRKLCERKEAKTSIPVTSEMFEAHRPMA